ncbi:MAG TPA: hypothetical protein VLJ11_12915 [Bryobacteraceae bacterium]|nr:hypothetical protein [Bryobacteraceae bacterium]
MEAARSDQASAMVSIYDCAKRPLAKQVLLRVRNDSSSEHISKYADGPDINVVVPFHNGPHDEYTVVVSADGYRDTGYCFRADPRVRAQVHLLMVPKDHRYEFLDWEDLGLKFPQIAAFLSVGTDSISAKSRYVALQENNPQALACLLNITTAMAAINLAGRSPLSFFRAICWDATMGQDRFFGFVDPAMIQAVRAAAENGDFAEEKDCAAFHPGSTCSWKQTAFDVANLQLTFHERTTRVIDGVTCVMIEPDVDDYKNLVRHGFEEVLPNLVTGGKTDPAGVFALRWATAERGGPAFDPGYVLA